MSLLLLLLLLMLLFVLATAFSVNNTKVMKLKELKPKFPTPPGHDCLLTLVFNFLETLSLILKFFSNKILRCSSKLGSVVELLLSMMVWFTLRNTEDTIVNSQFGLEMETDLNTQRLDIIYNT